MKTGGVVLTMMPNKWHRGGIFHWFLFWWQRIFLWFRFAHHEHWGKSYLNKEVRKTCARISHIHLDVGQSQTGRRKLLSITVPMAVFEWWPPESILYDATLKWGTDPDSLKDGVKHVYLLPQFEVNDTFGKSMMAYAEDLVQNRHRRYYDVLQLISFIVNLFLWIFRPSKWGTQLNHWFNLRGGKEVCSTGVAATLRHAEFQSNTDINKIVVIDPRTTPKGHERYITTKSGTQFFPGYDIAMVPPCLYPLSQMWDAVAILNAGGIDDGTKEN